MRARRTSRAACSAMGSPLATSGRFCRRIQPERPRSDSVSPRSAKSTADDACGKPHRSQGPMAKSGPISCRTAQKSHDNCQREQGTEACSERGLRFAKLHPEHTSVPCSLGAERSPLVPSPRHRGAPRCFRPNFHQRRKALPLPPLSLALPALIPGPDILLHPVGKMEGCRQIDPHVALV